jgi:hypothetical protein
MCGLICALHRERRGYLPAGLRRHQSGRGGAARTRPAPRLRAHPQRPYRDGTAGRGKAVGTQPAVGGHGGGSG